MSCKPLILTAMITMSSLVMACQDNTPFVPIAIARRGGHLGAVAVRVELNPGRSTLAHVNDINQLEFDLSEPGLYSDETRFISRTELFDTLTGPPMAVFLNLPPGEATVILSAFDSGGQTLGTAKGNAPIDVGSTTTMSMTLVLQPTYVYPTPDSSADSGSSSGSGTSSSPYSSPTPGPMTAMLTITAALFDGPTIVVTPTPAAVPTP